MNSEFTSFLSSILSCTPYFILNSEPFGKVVALFVVVAAILAMQAIASANARTRAALFEYCAVQLSQIENFVAKYQILYPQNMQQTKRQQRQWNKLNACTAVYTLDRFSM